MLERSVARANPYVLLAFITAAFVMAPFTTPGTAFSRVLQVGAVGMLIVAVWRAGGSRRFLVLAIGFAVLNELCERITPGYPNTWVVVLNLLLDFVFVALIAAFLGARAWRTPRVDAETLVAAVTVYLLLGYFWATAYSILEYTDPGSFANLCPEPSGPHACAPELGRFPRLSYFSFVTISTLGFGDIVPLAARAEGLTVLAAVSGQLYVAVLIGRLVGDYLANRREGRED